MALIVAPVKTINITLQDRNNNKSTLTFYTPTAVVTEDVTTFITGTLIPNINAISNATVVGWSVSQGAYDDVGDNIDLASDVERKMSVSFATEDRSTMSLEVPSLKQSLVVKDTNVVNSADAGVTAFLNMIVDDGLFDTYGMGNFRGARLIAVKTPPMQTHRKSSKG